MRFHWLACVGLWIAAVGAACNSGEQNNCEQFGGVCVSSTAVCGGSLPYTCNSGVCCEPTLVPPGPAPTTTATGTAPTSTATSPGPDASAPPVDAAPDSTVAPPPDTGTTADTAPADDVASGDSSPAEDSDMPDTNVPDTNMPDTFVADTFVADTTPPPADVGAIPTTCTQADSTYGCCGPNNTNYYCGTNTPTTVSSTACTGTKVCGWNATKGYYDCVAPPASADPSGVYPLACQ